MIRRLVISIGLLFSLTCCTEYSSIDATWLESDKICLAWKGSVQVEYKPATFQLGYNNAKNEYRVYDDHLAYWFTVRCSEKPASEGQKFTADVSWTGMDKVKDFKGLEFVVKKVEDSGIIWIWNQSQSISIIVKNI